VKALCWNSTFNIQHSASGGWRLAAA